MTTYINALPGGIFFSRYPSVALARKNIQKINWGQTTETNNTQTNKGSPLLGEEVTYRITLIRCCQGGLGKGGGRKASEDVHGEVPRFLPCILPSTYQVAGKRVYTSCLARKATKFGHFHFNLNFNIYDAQ